MSTPAPAELVERLQHIEAGAESILAALSPCGDAIPAECRLGLQASTRELGELISGLASDAALRDSCATVRT